MMFIAIRLVEISSKIKMDLMVCHYQSTAIGSATLDGIYFEMLMITRHSFFFGTNYVDAESLKYA